MSNTDPGRKQPLEPEREVSHELISALLDGELSGDEQARVERRIADDRQWRQTYEELQVLRRRLQSLPQSHLESDFSNRVLRRAEREMLSMSPADAPVAASGDSTVGRPPEIARDRGVIRGLVWAAAAIAAAVILTMFFPGQTDVVLGPTKTAESNALIDSDLENIEESRTAAPAEADGNSFKVARPPANNRAASGSATQVDAGRQQKNARSLGVLQPESEDSVILGLSENVVPDAGEGQVSFGARSILGKKNKAGTPLADAEHKQRPVAAMDTIGRLYGGIPAAAENTLAVDWDGTQLPGKPTLVVTLYVPPATYRDRVLDDSLANNGIFFESSDDQDALEEANGKSDRDLATRRGVLREQLDKADRKRSKDGLRANTLAAGVDCVFVEAGRDQIEAVLTELHNRSDQYLAVRIGSPDGLDFDRYERIGWGGTSVEPYDNLSLDQSRQAAADASSATVEVPRRRLSAATPESASASESAAALDKSQSKSARQSADRPNATSRETGGQGYARRFNIDSQTLFPSANEKQFSSESPPQPLDEQPSAAEEEEEKGRDDNSRVTSADAQPETLTVLFVLRSAGLGPGPVEPVDENDQK